MNKQLIINMNKLSKQKKLGQVFTPSDIANNMAKIIVEHNKFDFLKVLDPCIGPSTFLNAFNEITLKSSVEYYGFDIDKHMVAQSTKTAKNVKFSAEIKEEDYLLKSSLNIVPNAVIMNPPYVRHEWIPASVKTEYKNMIKTYYGKAIDGRSNLFVYFILKSFHELQDNGLLCVIVYDAIKSSVYGKKLLTMLSKNSTVEYEQHIQTPFENAIVDAKILLLRKVSKPIVVQESLVKPTTSLLTTLNELVDCKRGTGLISSKLFIANQDNPYINEAQPFLKKQPLNTLIVTHENIKQKAFLFQKNEKISIPLQEWLKKEAIHLCRNTKHTKTLFDKIQLNSKWMKHSVHKAPILFNYYIRNNPRYLLNQELIPYSDNFYGIYPKNLETKVIWLLLNTPTYIKYILKNARNQGNGLIKLQLYEFKNALVPDWRLFDSNDLLELKKLAINLYKYKETAEILYKADKIVENKFKGLI